MLATCFVGSIDRVLREAEAVMGPLPPVVDAPVPLKVAPFATGTVATPRRLAAVALGPLIALGSHFLELLIDFEYWRFTTLRLPDVVRRAISAPGLSIGEVMLVEQSRPELIWPVDIILGMGGNAVLSEHWRAFALGHRLRIGDRLVFHFKLETLEASVRIFITTGIRRAFPQPVAAEERGGIVMDVFSGGELVSSPLL
jgi:hypothetical protein